MNRRPPGVRDGRKQRVLSVARARMMMGTRKAGAAPIAHALDEVQLAAELEPTVADDFQNEEVDIDREIFFNESTYGKKRQAVTPQAAVALVQSSNSALEEAVNARQKAAKRGVTSNELIPEEASFLETVSTAICLLRKSNYVVQKDLQYIRTRGKESTLAQNEIRRIIEKSIRDKDVVIEGLKKEIAEVKERQSEYDELIPEKWPLRSKTLRQLGRRIMALKESTAKSSSLLLEAKKNLQHGAI